MTTNPTNHPSSYGPKGDPGYSTSSYLEHRRREAATEAVLWSLLGLAALVGGLWWFLDEDPGIHQRTYDLLQNGWMFLAAMLLAYHAVSRRD